MATEVNCYRKGCGKTFNPSENKADACRYHPGAPIFHDAIKKWSCCDKKTTDFSVFLDMPGCTSGFHSNEKPLPPPKVESKPLPDELVIRGPPPKPAERSERPDITEPMVTLQNTVGASLKQALEKRMVNLQLEKSQQMTDQGTEGVVQIGTACQNKACGAHYDGPASNDEECIHHPGVPIFHEGMKYWSCCKKKTTEFDKFMAQVGCETGKHIWVAAKDPSKQANCRMDWHQTGSYVTISVFAKCADFTKTVVKANQVSINISIIYEDDKLFTESFELNGVVDLSKSTVKLLGSKVEIILKKSQPDSWAQLKYKQP